MRITELQIKNYRSIGDSAKLEIKKLFALIGKNNTGKSALIDAIQVFWGNKKVDERDFHKATKNPIEIELTIRDYCKLEVAKEYEDAEGNISISLKIDKADLKKPKYQINGEETRATIINKLLPELLVIPAIRDPQVETTAGAKSYLKELTSSLLDLKASQKHDLEEIKKLKAQDLDIDQINALLEDKTKSQIKAITDKTSNYFQDAVNDSTMSLEIDPHGDISKALSYITNILDPYLGKELAKINILSCGTGLQSLVILALLQAYADINTREDSIMLIEEPEVYLHPELQRKMFDAMRKIAQNTQVIYTTHSPIMISELWSDSVRLVKREKGETSIEPVDIGGVISELGIRYDDVLNPQLVVFVEGTSDVVFYEMIIKKLYPYCASDLDRIVKFISTTGYQNIHTFALMSILLSGNVKAKYFLFVDSDGEEGRERALKIHGNIIKEIPEAKEKFNVDEKIKVLSEYAIESTFLDYEQIVKLAPEVKEADFEYFKSFYIKKYSDARSKYLGEKSKENKKFMQSNYKPKLLFEDPRHNSILVKVKEAYENDKKFLETREIIVKAYNKQKKDGREPIHIMFEGLDGKALRQKSLLGDPIAFIDHAIKIAGIDKMNR